MKISLKNENFTKVWKFPLISKRKIIIPRKFLENKNSSKTENSPKKLKFSNSQRKLKFPNSPKNWKFP